MCWGGEKEGKVGKREREGEKSREEGRGMGECRERWSRGGGGRGGGEEEEGRRIGGREADRVKGGGRWKGERKGERGERWGGGEGGGSWRGQGERWGEVGRESWETRKGKRKGNRLQ